MPLYEYECQACHRRIEKIRSSFSAPPETVCPHCGGHLEQTLSAPAVQFKGSGWYVNDYAKSGAPPKKSADSSKEGSDSAAAKSSEASTGSSTDNSAAPAKESSKESSAPAKTESAAAPSSSSAKSD